MGRASCPVTAVARLREASRATVPRFGDDSRNPVAAVRIRETSDTRGFGNERLLARDWLNTRGNARVRYRFELYALEGKWGIDSLADPLPRATLSTVRYRGPETSPKLVSQSPYALTDIARAPDQSGNDFGIVPRANAGTKVPP